MANATPPTSWPPPAPGSRRSRHQRRPPRAAARSRPWSRSTSTTTAAAQPADVISLTRTRRRLRGVAEAPTRRALRGERGLQHPCSTSRRLRRRPGVRRRASSPRLSASARRGPAVAGVTGRLTTSWPDAALDGGGVACRTLEASAGMPAHRRGSREHRFEARPIEDAPVSTTLLPPPPPPPSGRASTLLVSTGRAPSSRRRRRALCRRAGPPRRVSRLLARSRG